MNLGSANVAIRQRGVLEVFDLAFVVMRTLGRRVYARLGAATLLPVWLLCVVGQRLLQVPWGLMWIVAVVASGLLQAPFTIAAGRLMFEREVLARDVFRGFLRRLPSFLFVLLVSRGLLALAASTVLLLPAAWSRVLFVHEVCLLEAASGRDCLRRASSFVRYHGSATFSTLVLHLVMTVIMVLWGELLGWGVVSWLLQLGQPFDSLWEQGGSPFALAGLFASAPVLATARYLAYIDGRTRRDAWDVQVRFQAIALEGKGAAS